MKNRFLLSSIIYISTIVSICAFEYRVRKLSVNEGLSQCDITHIHQDQSGYMWISTFDGLNRYDGIRNIIYYADSNTPNTLPSNRVLTIAENKNDIWGGTQGCGIFKINLLTNEIKSYYLYSQQIADRDWNIVKQIHISADNPDHLWILTKLGLLKVQLPPDGIQKLQIIDSIELTDGHKWVFIGNTLLVSTNEGLMEIEQYDTPSLRTIKPLLPEHKTGDMLQYQSGCYITTDKAIYYYHRHKIKPVFKIQLCEKKRFPDSYGILGRDNDENVLFYSRATGIIRFDGPIAAETVKSLHIYPNDFFVNNEIRQLFVDRSNTLWITSYNKGAIHIDLQEKGFSNIRIEHVKITDNINCLKADNHQNLWIGSRFEGVVVINSADSVINYPYRSHFGKTIAGIDKDKNGNMWILGSNGLFIVKDISSPPILANKQKGYEPIALRGIINRISCDTAGIWGIVQGDILYVEKRGEQLITQFTNIGIKETRKIYKEPNSDRIWIGTNGQGLYCFSVDKDKKLSLFKHYTAGKPRSQGLSSNSVWDIKLVDNQLWIGTDNGLDCMDKKGTITPIDSIRRKIYCITPDQRGELWLNTSRGLVRYDPLFKKTETYNTSEGLPDNGLSFSSESLPNGRIYVGSINGLTYFNPSYFNLNQFIPSVAFTSLELFNKQVSVGQQINGRILLQQEIDYSTKITLKYNENHFTLNFIALQFNNAERMKYRYRLTGFDRDWITRSYRQNSVTYSNLPAGTYQFELLASNNDDQWASAPKTLTIEILPAPFHTHWAYTFYSLLIFLFIGLFMKYYQTRKEKKKEEVQQQIERQKAKELIDFFGNLMHEIRTPLTLIANPVKEIIETSSLESEIYRKLQTVFRNTNRLLHLINLYAIRRFIQPSDKENNKDEFVSEMKMGNIIKTIRNAAEAFSLTKESKQIDYYILLPDRHILASFNEDKIEIAITNLISNAFKFTPQGGCITLETLYTKNEIKIQVKDTGIGIPEEDLPHLFERFFKAKNSHPIGTGIGLHFTKQIVEEHNGQISVESKLGEGTIFTITLPVEKIISQHHPSILRELPQTVVSTSKKSQEIKFKLLIVDDDPSIINYLAQELKPEYHLSFASDGSCALEKLKKERHDLIISDVAMSGMDGLELCRIVKHKQIYSAVPVILLSGKSSEDDQLEGYRSGADDYLIKPISMKLLKAKIESILENRKIRMHTIEEIVMQSAGNNTDRELLNKVLLYIENNLSSNALSVESIAREFKTNRVQLHRHISRITGRSVSDFIREMRMTKSLILLQSGNYSIKEVVFMVGYGSPSFFSKTFKCYYGKTPRDISSEK